MPLPAGTRIGIYEVASLLGAGGMGEVYRAHDPRLKRDVAIKILPLLVASDQERLERFEREAQALAALNHPHIAQVYGLEQHGELRAIVMELVSGTGLDELIAAATKGLPLAESLKLARQITDALEAAHDKGIVHRDLKPANVMVSDDGVAKILDFGLAKSLDPSGATGSLANSPTLTARATQLGLILGTAAYMAPEQARGKPVDKRADIWAFGAVLFEMLTGARAFDGDDVTDVLARVLERDPNWSLLPASTPPPLRRLLERCLTKDPKARLRDIGEARHALDEIVTGRAIAETVAPRSGAMAAYVPEPPSAPATRPIAWLPWAVAAAFGALALFFWFKPSGSPPAGDARPKRVELTLPADVEFFSSPRLSPDGARVAFVGVREGTRQVYTRDLDQTDTRPVPGTEGAMAVAFSPDSGSIAVVTTDAKIKRVSLVTGSVDELVSGVDLGSSGTWTPDGKIVFGRQTSLAWMPAVGGAITTIVDVSKDANQINLVNPLVTPDGKTVLFTSWRDRAAGGRSRVEAVPIAGGAAKVVVEDADHLVAVFGDRLLYQRDNAIYVVPFDASRVVTTGAPRRLLDEVRVNPPGSAAADVATDGTLLFASNRVFNGRLVWVSADGVERVLPLPPHQYANPRVSPDGRSIAFSDGPSIWTFDVERGAKARIFLSSDGLTGFSAWSGDSRFVFFRTANGIVRQRADGEGKPEVVPGTTRADYPNSVSPDGSLLAFIRISSASGGDIMVMPVAGGEARAVVATPAYEGGPQFSPDGKWLTYVSNSSGRMEVYLRPLEGPDRRIPVSTSGGMHPLWSRDGKRIFFRNAQQILAVDVATIPDLHLSAPKVLLERRYAFGPNLTIPNYSLSKDGREFLVVRDEGGGGHLSMILNWLQSVK